MLQIWVAPQWGEYRIATDKQRCSKFESLHCEASEANERRRSRRETGWVLRIGTAAPGWQQQVRVKVARCRRRNEPRGPRRPADLTIWRPALFTHTTTRRDSVTSRRARAARTAGRGNPESLRPAVYAPLSLMFKYFLLYYLCRFGYNTNENIGIFNVMMVLIVFCILVLHSRLIKHHFFISYSHFKLAMASFRIITDKMN